MSVKSICSVMVLYWSIIAFNMLFDRNIFKFYNNISNIDDGVQCALSTC